MGKLAGNSTWDALPLDCNNKNFKSNTLEVLVGKLATHEQERTNKECRTIDGRMEGWREQVPQGAVQVGSWTSVEGVFNDETFCAL